MEDDIIVTAVPVLPWKCHGFSHYSEVEFLAFEEIRFLAALSLSLHPDHGMIYPYPLRGASVDLNGGVEHTDEQLVAAGRRCLADPAATGLWWRRSMVLPPGVGGPPYEWHEHSLNSELLNHLMGAIDLEDHLLISGLNALITSDMLWESAFGVAAIQSQFVAMEASFQMVLRVLKGMGIASPTADDAGAFIDANFNPEVDTGRYFEEFYRTRIITMHPQSRFGVFALPPLQADDYYFLRHSLNEVFVLLITGQKSIP